MIDFDPEEGRLPLKLVSYGPAPSGTATNLLKVHDLLPRRGRGGLMLLDTKDERTIAFDLLAFSLETPSGLRIKLTVSTALGLGLGLATAYDIVTAAGGTSPSPGRPGRPVHPHPAGLPGVSRCHKTTPVAHHNPDGTMSRNGWATLHKLFRNGS